MADYRWSAKSAKFLASAHVELRGLFDEVLTVCDVRIIAGHRGRTLQNQYFQQGKTQVEWPDSYHNKQPSLAIDACRYPVIWNDRERQTLFAGLVLGIAHRRGLAVTWGGDWNRDWNVRDNKFDDLVHFQLET